MHILGASHPTLTTPISTSLLPNNQFDYIFLETEDYVREFISVLELTYRNASRRHKGYLWIYGDSTATRLHWSIHGKPLCHKVFKRCFYSYGWIYQIDNYNLTLDQFIRRNPNRTFLKLNDNNDFNANRIVEELKQVLLNPKMDEFSVLLLNYGLHFAEASNFSNFRILIDKIATLLQNKTAFKPTVIWRSSTALNRHKYSMPHLHSRRFLTPQVCLGHAFLVYHCNLFSIN